MGQFEKIVVLTVLSLVAVILVISFSTGDETLAGFDESGLEGASSELGPGLLAGGQAQPAPIQGRGARRAPAPRELDLASPFDRFPDDEADYEREELARAEDAAAPARELEWPDGLESDGEGAGPTGANPLRLSSNVTPDERAQRPPRDPGLDEDAALVTLRGLEDTWDPELKQYTWRQGDSFAALAKRFYGDEGRASLLTLFNEGRDRVAEGETILVPVFDRRGEVPEGARAGSLYVVQEGESLWGIAKKHYGNGAGWERIFEANRDRLDAADDVRAGMEIRIP